MKGIVKKPFAWYKKGDIVEITPRDQYLVSLGIIEEIKNEL